MITRDQLLKITVVGTSIENVWNGLFYAVPTTDQLVTAIQLDIEDRRETLDSDPVNESHLDSIVSDLLALVQVVEHGDTLNAGPVVIAKCEIGKLIYSRMSIFVAKDKDKDEQ